MQCAVFPIKMMIVRCADSRHVKAGQLIAALERAGIVFISDDGAGVWLSRGKRRRQRPGPARRRRWFVSRPTRGPSPLAAVRAAPRFRGSLI